MKKSLITIVLFVSLAILSLSVTSCGGQKAEASEETAEIVYACPMHPEVTGKETDTCSKCGMALEKVEEAGAEEGHDHH